MVSALSVSVEQSSWRRPLRRTTLLPAAGQSPVQTSSQVEMGEKATWWKDDRPATCESAGFWTASWRRRCFSRSSAPDTAFPADKRPRCSRGRFAYSPKNLRIVRKRSWGSGAGRPACSGERTSRARSSFIDSRTANACNFLMAAYRDQDDDDWDTEDDLGDASEDRQPTVPSPC